jgi:hypothetical protein
MPYPDKYVSEEKDIPDVEHWAIFKGDSVHIPGDERSRQSPGHGYPAGDRKFISYEVYLTQEKLMAEIKDLEKNNRLYKVAKITPMKVTKTVNIDLTL